jgi:hypothetical protein
VQWSGDEVNVAFDVESAIVPRASEGHLLQPRLQNISMRIRIEEFVAELFHPYVGTRFSFRTPERPEAVVQLQLREVCPAPAVFDPLRPPGNLRRGGFFSLLFVTESEIAPSSGLYQLDHPDFEPTPLLLSRVVAPRRPRDDPPLFEAVFG